VDRKAFIQALLWATAAFAIWVVVAQRILPTRPAVTRPADAGAWSAPSSTTGPAATAPTSRAEMAPAGAYRAVGTDEPASIAMGNVADAKDSPYRMHLELSGRGAAIESAGMTDYAETVNGRERYRLLAPVSGAGGREQLSLAVENVSINGQDVRLVDVNWRAVRSEDASGQTATFEVDLVDENGAAAVRLRRIYRLAPQPVDTTRRDLRIDWTVENLTDQPHEVRLTERGPVGIPQAYSRAEDRYIYAAVSLPTETQTARVDPKLFSKVSGANEKREILYKRGAPEKFWWLGAGNKYFSCILVPVAPDGTDRPEYVEQADAVDLDGDALTSGDVTTRLVSRLDVPPRTSRSAGVDCYLGPNDKKAFARPANADYVRRDYRRIIAVQYGSCTFGWLTDAMVLLLDGLEKVVGNYGVAIIILVLIVRLILHPITKKGQVNMVRMQERMGKLQPKIEQLKERFGNDRGRLQQETMKLYKEEGVNPATSMAGSCLPMAIQMPVWIALYTSLSNNIEMRHRGFVLWIHDLTAPDAMIPFAGTYHVPLLSKLTGEISALNLLPILMAISMYLQQKLTPKPQPPAQSGRAAPNPQMDQAAQMQKMMPLMSIFFALICYAMPSGLNLYIMTSSLLGALEQHVIRKHLKKVKEKGLATGPPPDPLRDPARPPSWLARKFHAIQKQADDAQRLGGKRKK